MIEHTLDTVRSILSVRAKTPLEQGAFLQFAKTVDPYIEDNGDLAGMHGSACWTQLRLVCAAHSNFRPSSPGVRPARTSSITCCRSSSGDG